MSAVNKQLPATDVAVWGDKNAAAAKRPNAPFTINGKSFDPLNTVPFGDDDAQNQAAARKKAAKATKAAQPQPATPLDTMLDVNQGSNDAVPSGGA